MKIDSKMMKIDCTWQVSDIKPCQHPLGVPIKIVDFGPNLGKPENWLKNDDFGPKRWKLTELIPFLFRFHRNRRYRSSTYVDSSVAMSSVMLNV